VADGSQPSLAAACTVLGLGRAWVSTLDRLEEDLSEPVAWHRRFLAATEPVSLADLRMVALRMAGLGPTRIAGRMGRRSVPTRQHVARTGLAVAVRLVDASPSSQGVEALRPGSAGHRLVHEGLPPYTDDPISQDAFDRLWLQGLPLRDIRAQLSIGPKVAKTHAAAALPRWVGTDVAAFLGWSRENHRRGLGGDGLPHLF
jgi:hypothetical protein